MTRPRTLLSLAVICFSTFTLVFGAVPASASDAQVSVEEFTLDNGMKWLLVQRPEQSTVTGGWVARVGSANERPGITGISHLFEHMMFKGTHVVGTTDIERDLEILAEQEEIQQQIRRIYKEQRQRWRRGEIEDPFDPANRTPEMIELEERFQKLLEEQRALMVKDEFDQIYTAAGASGMNAGTSEDFTIYFITVPANKLELWFWMESDRLLNPVFREFYSERDVVQEERRLRLESTPTGKFDEQFNTMFWGSHPYSWSPVGIPSDLRVISKQQADDYFATYYAADNLTAALVGNFAVDEAKELAERYFGRLLRSPRPVPDVSTMELPQLAEKRMSAQCDCQPQVEIRYHTVPFMHADSYPLEVLAGLMNGRTGRLYKSLVLDQGVASTATASQSSDKWAGSFSFAAETKGEATPDQLEAAWYEELQRLVDEPIPETELQKVKNQIQADAYRRLESSFFLLLQLLIYDNGGDWQYLNTWADRTLEVTQDDVKRVIETYFDATNRAVAQYDRLAGAVAEVWPEAISQLSTEQQEMVKTQIRQLRQIQDPAQLEQILEQIQQQKGAAPADFQPAIGVLEQFVRDRIEDLAGTGGTDA
jgi:predicted Zn-dependent peptidase